jgi:3-oxoacyl-[acyl-carrier protein] reductase
VNTASTAPIRPRPGAAAYTASKGGVVALTRQLALELVDDGICVEATCLAVTDMPMVSYLNDSEIVERTVEELRESIAMGPFIQSEGVADAVAFLAETGAIIITRSRFRSTGIIDSDRKLDTQSDESTISRLGV